MNQDYNTFFSIELLHEYFLNHKCNDLEIIPAEDCMGMSKQMNLHWRFSDNRLISLIKVNEADEPFINIPPARSFRKLFAKNVFRFYVRLKNPVFLNYTNVDLAALRGRIFYFSNLAKNSDREMKYLTKPVKDYALNKNYVPGNLVTDPATGNVYEAIKKHHAKKKAPFADDTLWIAKGPIKLPKAIKDHIIGKRYFQGDVVKRHNTDDIFEAIKNHTSKSESELDDPGFWEPARQARMQYSTENDLTEFSNGTYTFSLPAAVTKASIVVLGFRYDEKSHLYDFQELSKEDRSFENPVSQVAISLSSLEPGNYEIRVNKEVRHLYYDPLAMAGNVLGIIEIFNYLPGDDDYALLTDEEKLKNNRFRIQFPNRRVLWKYIRKDSKAESITDTGDTGYEFNLEGDDFVSSIPIPLSEDVLKTLKLEFNTKDFRLFPLPNPQINRLARYTQHDYDYLCSEVHLNY